MKKILPAAIGLVILALFLRTRPGITPVEVRRLALGTVITVKLFEEEERARALIGQAFAEIGRIEAMMSRHRENSEVNQLERLALEQPVVCSMELVEVLQRAQHFSRLTSGAIDVTVGALTRLWDFPQRAVPPAQAQIDSALALVGYQGLEINGRQVRIGYPGTRFDLGGVAKGYAVDRAVELLQELGVRCGLIEAGGDIHFWGNKPDGHPWRFGIQHPLDPARYLEVDDIGLAGIATSGNYEQFFEYEGKRYHHIIDPATGYPADRSISATAWARNALDADILSTAIFILGPEQGIDLIETIPGAEAMVFFARDGLVQRRASSGVAGRLRFSDADD